LLGREAGSNLLQGVGAGAEKNMKVRHLAAVVAINFLTGALVTVGYAAEKPAVKRTDPGVLREARGKVKDIDKGKNQVVLDRSAKEALTLQVDKSTTIFIDGRIGTLDEVEPGGEVRASYEFRQGANRAQWIEIDKRAAREGSERLPEAPAVAPPSSGPGVPR
jgi:hypothetical protein